MAYYDNLTQQFSDLQRQFQQLQGLQNPPNLPPSLQPNMPIFSHQVQYVEGIIGAKRYQQEKLQPNCSEVIMDKDDNVFYLVSKDANGTPSKKIPTARFSIIEDTQDDDPVVLTRKDLDNFKEEIRQLLKEAAPLKEAAL